MRKKKLKSKTFTISFIMLLLNDYSNFLEKLTGQY